MSKPQLDQLIATLQEAEQPKMRRKVCKQLAASGDPAVIPALRHAYENDPDEDVRMIARRGLLRFRKLEARLHGKGRVANRLLSLLLGLLIVAFAASLILRMSFADALVQSMGDALDDLRQGEPTATFRPLQVTERTELVAQVTGHLNELRTFAGSLRNETVKFDANSRPDCETIPAYVPPEGFSLSADDQSVYPDLATLTTKLGGIREQLPTPLGHLQKACEELDKPLEHILDAAIALDSVDALLQDADQRLQQAIANPAPTVWPTPTPQPPSATPSMTPSPTLVPASPTASLEPGAAPPLETTIPTAVASPEPLQTPTPTLSPTPSLPLPALDYATIIAELRLRFAESFLLDLQNPYGTGMLDQWQQAVSARGQASTNYCTLSTWPLPYALPADQAALIDNVTAADALLQDTIRLQNEGLAAAAQARLLYERDCPLGALTSSASEGIALLTEAISKLAEARSLLDAVANRP